MDTGGHQAGNMGHVDHEIGIHRPGNMGQPLKIDDPGIGAGSGHNHLWPLGPGQFIQRIVVDGAGFPFHPVMEKLEEPTGKAHRAAMGQVSAMGQIHSQKGVPRVEQGEVDRHVGLGPRMGLDIDIGSAKQLLGPLHGQIFRHVHMFATTVIPLGRIPFGIFVGQNAALDRHNGPAGDIFRCDQFQGVGLPIQFLPQHSGNFRVDAFKVFRVQQSVLSPAKSGSFAKK